MQDARGEALPGDRGLVDVEPDAREAQWALRPLPFDAARHPILSEELKHLYTAVSSACSPCWLHSTSDGAEEGCACTRLAFPRCVGVMLENAYV